MGANRHPIVVSYTVIGPREHDFGPPPFSLPCIGKRGECMTAIEDLLARNARSGTGPGSLPGPPSLHVAVVACMDARLDPARLLCLRPGEAHVIRNAGGVVTDDVIRSLAVSQRKLGTTEVMLLHHTRCGMTTFTDDDFCCELQEATGLRPTWAVETFRDVESDVRQSLERVRRSPFLPNTTALRGFVVDIETGTLNEVLPAPL
jgi:carbonic anhydrase